MDREIKSGADEREAALTARIETLERELARAREEQASLQQGAEGSLAQMRETKKRYRAIIDSFDGEVYICSRDYRIEFMNRQMMERIGADAVGKPCYEALHRLDGVCPWCVNERVFGGETVRWEVQSPKDGRWYYMVNTPLYNEDGSVSKHAMIQDITERKVAEERRSESEDKFRGIFENAPVGIYQTGVEGGILSVNPTLARLFGYAGVDEMLAAEPLSAGSYFADPSVRDRVVADALASRGFVHAEVAYRRRDGSTFTGNLSMRAERGDDGVVRFLEGFIEDVSEEKLTKEQLLQAQKMEAVGQLAGGIAHDFNNILTAIIGFASIMQLRMPPGDPLQGNVDQILSAAARAASLTQSLLTFSRTQNGNLKLSNLNDILGDLGRFLKRIIGEEITFRTSFAGDVPAVNADAGQIQQVVMNLATNARDEMPKGGVLTIGTELRVVDEQFVARHGLGAPGSYAVISVSDTGCGMEEDTRKRIFEPFFTTKEVGKGTGLGLSIVYGIVKQHSGFIVVHSAVGEGTTFEIFLPAAEPGASAAEKPRDADAARGGNETILLAEDDASVRQLMRNILSSYGYRVVVAEDGRQAVASFEEHRDEVKLLLFDMIMPGKNGKDAYEEICRSRPGVPVLYFSGYTMDYIRHRGDLPEGVELIMKPVEPVELLRKVRSMLDR